MTLGGGKVRLHGGKVRRGVKKIAKNDCYDFFSWKSFFIFFLKLPRHKSLFTYTFLFSFFLSLTFTRHFFCPFVTCWLIKSFLFLFCYMLTKKIWYILHEKEVDCMHTMPTNHLTSIWWESSVSHYPSCMPKD